MYRVLRFTLAGAKIFVSAVVWLLWAATCFAWLYSYQHKFGLIWQEVNQSGFHKRYYVVALGRFGYATVEQPVDALPYGLVGRSRSLPRWQPYYKPAQRGDADWGYGAATPPPAQPGTTRADFFGLTRLKHQDSREASTNLYVPCSWIALSTGAAALYCTMPLYRWWRKRRRRRHGLCPACGYDLRGSSEDMGRRCPECGKTTGPIQ
jgi:hypothetical protein